MTDMISKILKSTNLIQRVSEIEYHHSPRECIYQTEKTSLYHYSSAAGANSTPLLIVFATVNRPEILDIFPDRSLIKGLIDKNQDVYLLDWGYPDKSDKETTFSAYISTLDKCVKCILKKTNHKKINLLGICQGGVISISYTALSNSIKNLILISTPIDFHTKDNLVSNLLNKVDIDAVTQTVGNVPGTWLTDFFISLRPFELVGKKYLRFYENIDNTEFTNRFLRVEKWLRDAPDQPGVAFSDFVKDCYQQNKLIAGKLKINKKTVNLSRIKIPIFNIMASEDEIVPQSASLPLKQYVSSKDYTVETFSSGHIGIYVSDKVGASLSHAISDWLIKRG